MWFMYYLNECLLIEQLNESMNDVIFIREKNENILLYIIP